MKIAVISGYSFLTSLHGRGRRRGWIVRKISFYRKPKPSIIISYIWETFMITKSKLISFNQCLCFTMVSFRMQKGLFPYLFSSMGLSLSSSFPSPTIPIVLFVSLIKVGPSVISHPKLIHQKV